MKAYDIVIIGGGPAGLTTALSARNTYPDKSILLIRKEKIALIPCGIPYIFHTLEKIEDDILSDVPLQKNNVDMLIDEVESVNGKDLNLKNSDKIRFEKLVLATGSYPFKPPISGIEKDGVAFIKKDIEYLRNLNKKIEKAKNVSIVGGGYIGVEIAEELTKAGKNVVLVEKLPSVLPLAMDKEFCDMVQEVIEENSVKVILNKAVKEIKGNDKVESILIEDGTSYPSDVVIVAVGYRPNLALAKKLGLKIEEKYGIVVDDYMRTSDKDVYAVGDCAAQRSCFSGDYSEIMLASSAMAQGRLAGSNLFKIKVMKETPGILGTFATKIGKVSFGVSGLTEAQAKSLGIEYIVGINETFDRHPGKLPDASNIYMKLIYSKLCHTLLGAQVRGGDSVGELINMFSVMIQNRMTEMEIDTMQIGTHPMLTPSPIAYPVINATVDAILKEYRMKYNS